MSSFWITTPIGFRYCLRVTSLYITQRTQLTDILPTEVAIDAIKQNQMFHFILTCVRFLLCCFLPRRNCRCFKTWCTALIWAIRPNRWIFTVAGYRLSWKSSSNRVIVNVNKAWMSALCVTGRMLPLKSRRCSSRFWKKTVHWSFHNVTLE